MTQSTHTSRWDRPASEDSLAKAAAALKSRGINAIVVDTAAQAKAKVLEILPQGAEIYTTTSATLDDIGLTPGVNDDPRFDSVRKRVTAVDQTERRRATRRMASIAQYILGSVHAVTEDGQVLAASMSGSQLAPYIFGAEKVIWVVGAQKVVKDLNEAFKRIEEQSLPMEDARLKSVAGPQANSAINKVMIVNKETVADRITMILVKERLGY